MFVREVVAHHQSIAGWHDPSVDDVVDAVLDRVGELVEQEGRLLPGAARALAACRARGPVALASSTPRPLIDRTLAHFGLADSFDVIHSAEDEPFGKPHPGVFLTAAARLGVAPAACVAFEDSPAGVRAAVAATMTCVAVPAADERDDDAFALATLLLGSLEELTDGWLDERYESSRDGSSGPGPR
jgi:sugar-phosphatase